MSFSPEWLALREPVDHAARSDDILTAVIKFLDNKEDIRVTDIGSGTGSTIRALKPLLPDNIKWHLVDHDAELLEIAKAEAADDMVTTNLADLSSSLETIFEKPADLLTTSAFLDLVSDRWLSDFIDAISALSLPFYAALTYDGRSGCLPPLPADKIILAAFNMHQKTDKGFGSALGPDAATTAITRFKNAGYQVTTSLSDWQAGPEHKEFQKILLDGWRGAASEIHPDLKNNFDEWYSKRITLLQDGVANGASAFVGHVDFLALPPV